MADPETPVPPRTPDPQTAADAGEVAEPLGGGLIRGIGLLLIVGAPIFLMTFSVLHMDTVNRAITAQGSLLMAPAGGEPVSETELFWQVALSPWLWIPNVALSLLVSLLAMIAVGGIVIVWRFVGDRLERRGEGRARRRYGALSDADAVLSADAWSHNLPEPDGAPEPESPTDPGGSAGPGAPPAP